MKTKKSQDMDSVTAKDINQIKDMIKEVSQANLQY